MKILWITNTIFPAPGKEIGIAEPVVGGWMYSSAKCLIDYFDNIKLGVASLYWGKKLKTFKTDKIIYYLIPRSTAIHHYDTNLENYWQFVKKEFSPDIVHIHGTEYPHGLAYINACGAENVVLSIQGIIGAIGRYYYGGIHEKELKKNITVRDIIKRDSIINQLYKLQQRAIYEKLLIKKVQHIIGRTSWDKAHTWTINPNANYYFCNETLRSEFYKNSWKENKCIKHQIFLSQSNYPLKGLPQVIKALPSILNYFPDSRVFVAGNDFVNHKNPWKITGYGKYIRKLMKSLNIKDKIIFTGLLTEQEMCKKYMESSVFICPSSIENSSNSVGEAQLLGVPTIASYVGGMSDMIIHHKTGLLYRFEEYEMLASLVCQIFSDSKLTNMLSQGGKEAAMKRHNRKKISKNLSSIYSLVCKK